MTLRTKIFLPIRGRAVARSFSVSRPRWEAAPLPARKPVGAFRGGLFGFLTGAVVAGASVYYYVLGDYRVSNEMLNDDITVCFKPLSPWLNIIPAVANYVAPFLSGIPGRMVFLLIQALQHATIKLQSYITELESRMDQLKKK